MPLPPSKPDLVVRGPTPLPPVKVTVEERAIIDTLRLEESRDEASDCYIYKLTVPAQALVQCSRGEIGHLKRPVSAFSDLLVNLANFLFALELKANKEEETTDEQP